MILKRITISFFFIWLALSFVSAENISWAKVDQTIYKVSNSYEKGKARELMGAYKLAADAYNYALTEANVLLRDYKLEKSKLNEILPYIIASSYRLAIVTEKTINGSMVYMYEQIERYNRTRDLISQTFAIISNLRIDRQIEIPPSYYAHLYYARALNNLAQAYALANGILWQKYFVYMPSEIVMITDQVNQDLEHYLFLMKIRSPSEIEPKVAEFLKQLEDDEGLKIILDLSFYIADREKLYDALVLRLREGIYNFRDDYKRRNYLLVEISKIKSYEEFERSDKSREFVDFLKSNLRSLKDN